MHGKEYPLGVMWWNCVDLSKVPRAPKPQWVLKAPKWHSTTKRQPIDKAGPPITPLSLCYRPQRQAPKKEPEWDGAQGASAWSAYDGRYQNVGPLPALGNADPRELAGAHYYANRHANSSHRASAVPAPVEKLRRPKSAPSAGMGAPPRPGSAGRSAPTMLRGWDGQRAMRMAHEDEFLQMLECQEVQNNMEALKREKQAMRDKVDGVDALADTSLYDLKVLHNGGQRAKASAGRRPQSADPTMRSQLRSERGASEFTNSNAKQSIDVNATDRMRDLCKEFLGEMRKNCQHMEEEGESAAALEQFIAPFEDSQSKKKREVQELLVGFAKGGGFFKSPSATLQPDEVVKQVANIAIDSRGIIDPQNLQDVEEPSSPWSPTSCRSLGNMPAQRAATLRLGELVGFLIGCCGSVRAAFETFDANLDHVLSAQEWEDGMMKLGFKDDVSYVFRLLGKGSDGLATLDEVQTLFNPFLKRTQ